MDNYLVRSKQLEFFQQRRCCAKSKEADDLPDDMYPEVLMPRTHRIVAGLGLWTGGGNQFWSAR